MQSSNIRHLEKTLTAMRRNNSKSVLLELSYLEGILEDIKALEIKILALKDEKSDIISTKPTTIHGGNFKFNK